MLDFASPDEASDHAIRRAMQDLVPAVLDLGMENIVFWAQNDLWTKAVGSLVEKCSLRGHKLVVSEKLQKILTDCNDNLNSDAKELLKAMIKKAKEEESYELGPSSAEDEGKVIWHVKSKQLPDLIPDYIGRKGT